MGSKTDQIKGYANNATGKVRQGVGQLLIAQAILLGACSSVSIATRAT